MAVSGPTEGPSNMEEHPSAGLVDIVRMSTMIMRPISVGLMNAEQQARHVDTSGFRDVPVNVPQQLLRVEGFPWKQFPPEITSDHTVGDVVHTVLISVAKKARGIVGTKSV